MTQKMNNCIHIQQPISRFAVGQISLLLLPLPLRGMLLGMGWLPVRPADKWSKQMKSNISKQNHVLLMAKSKYLCCGCNSKTYFVANIYRWRAAVRHDIAMCLPVVMLLSPARQMWPMGQTNEE